MRAITYARKYLAPWAATHMKELKRVVTTLVFNNTDCAVYKVSYMCFPLNIWNCLNSPLFQDQVILYQASESNNANFKWKHALMIYIL